MYLLATDVLSNLVKRRPSVALIARLAVVSPDQQFTSSTTVGELIYGAYRLTERTTLLLEQIEQLIVANMAVLFYDVASVWRYSVLRAALERRGTPFGDADLRIASIALARRLTLVTGNVSHFSKVPDLSIENWL
jgi:predicted nucleic acid-binding protein